MRTPSVRPRLETSPKGQAISGVTLPALGVAGAAVGLKATGGQLPVTGIALGVFFAFACALVLSGLFVRFLGARKH
jgi:hypothetical protein